MVRYCQEPISGSAHPAALPEAFPEAFEDILERRHSL
jgi:hypothetical protein